MAAIPDGEWKMSDTAESETEPVQPVVLYTNWNATNEFNAACQLVDDAVLCGERHVSLLVDALIRAGHLVEEWRGPHRDDIDAFLEVGGNKPVDRPATDKRPAKPADEILPIVKCVFHRLSKQQWTWRANALRQAFADDIAANDLAVYFKEKPPTKRAEEWAEKHRSPPKPRQRLEVPISGKLALPHGLTIPAEGLPVRLVQKGGKFALAIPKPKPE
jgi:hypothetical protein